MMKKTVASRNALRTIVLITLFLLITSLSVLAAAKLIRASGDSVPAGDSYGAYIDESKIGAGQRTIEFGSRTIRLSYSYTENLNELPASNRADNYGTYDVYVDANQTEYLFLLDSELFCGFKMIDVGMPNEQADAIPQEKALEIADRFLTEQRSNRSDYEFLSCEYRELNGYYDIEYYLPVCGYKSDDVLRLWVSSVGKLTAFSEFNYKRYDDLIIDPAAYEAANQKLGETVARDFENISFTVADSYITVDDNGRVVLVNVIDYTISSGDLTNLQRKLYLQPIG